MTRPTLNPSRTGANRPGQKFAALVRKSTDGCVGLISFMLAVMRGDVARLLPPALTDDEVEAIATAMRLVAKRGRRDREGAGLVIGR